MCEWWQVDIRMLNVWDELICLCSCFNLHWSALNWLGLVFVHFVSDLSFIWLVGFCVFSFHSIYLSFSIFRSCQLAFYLCVFLFPFICFIIDENATNTKRNRAAMLLLLLLKATLQNSTIFLTFTIEVNNRQICNIASSLLLLILL